MAAERAWLRSIALVAAAALGAGGVAPLQGRTVVRVATVERASPAPFVVVVPSVDPPGTEPESAAGAPGVLDDLYAPLLLPTGRAAGALYRWGSGLVPELASAVRHHDGAYSITLRRGVIGCDGDELTAADVAFALRRAGETAGAPGLSSWSSWHAAGMLGPLVTGQASGPSSGSVQVTGRFSLVMRPDPDDGLLPEMLAQTATAPLDEALVERHARRGDPWGFGFLAAHDAGFGPYCLSSYVPGREVVLSANPHWTLEPRPALRVVVLRAVASPVERLAELRSGVAQVAEGLGGAQYAALTPAGAVAPTGGASSPTGGASSPNAGASSPTAGASSPNAGASSPTGGASSPNAGASSPTGGASSPAGGAPAPSGNVPAPGGTRAAAAGSSGSVSTSAPVPVTTVARSARGSLPPVVLSDAATTGHLQLDLNFADAPWGPNGSPRATLMRQAVAAAIPYRQILTALGGGGAPWQGEIPPSIPGALTSPVALSTDLARAEVDLADAGHAGGVGLPASGLLLTYEAGEPILATVATLIQTGLAAAGIKVTLTALPEPVFQAALGSDAMALVSGGTTFPDAAWYTQRWYAAPAAGGALDSDGYDDPDLNALVARAASASGAERAVLARDEQSLELTDLPAVPLAVLVDRVAVAGDVASMSVGGPGAFFAVTSYRA